MTQMQLPADAHSSSPSKSSHHAAAYGRTAVVHGVDVSQPRFGGAGVGAQWSACQVAAHADGYLIPESPDFLFGEEGVSGLTTCPPQLERLLDTVRSGHAPFSRLYVTDTARLSRVDLDESIMQWLKCELVRHGIELRVLSTPRTFLDSPSSLAAYFGRDGGLRPSRARALVPPPGEHRRAEARPTSREVRSQRGRDGEYCDRCGDGHSPPIVRISGASTCTERDVTAPAIRTFRCPLVCSDGIGAPTSPVRDRFGGTSPRAPPQVWPRTARPCPPTRNPPRSATRAPRLDEARRGDKATHRARPELPSGAR